MFKLVIQDDEGKTTVVPLIRDEITIGRKEGNTIRLTERNVSRRHARIVRSNNEVQIEDLGSYNGIRVNNARIAERVALRVSDQVQIGDYKLYLKAEGVEQGDEARTMPIERVESAPGATTEVLNAVTPATQPIPVIAQGTQPPAPQAPNLVGSPNRTQVAVADTDPAGRPVASAAQVAAMSAPTGYGKLVCVSANFAGREFELSRPQMIVGRTDENDIVINHRSISRNHAKLVREPETGRYTISDLQSSNGVRVNGQDYGKVELRRGDVVDLGHVRLRFVEAGEDFVFARDAVITNVPEAGGGKKGLLVAVILGVVVLGGIGAFMVMKGGDDKPKVEAGKDPGSTNETGGTTGGSNAVVANNNNTTNNNSGGSNEVVAPPAPDAAPAVATNNTVESDVKLECLRFKADKNWTGLEDCTNRLSATDAATAKSLRATAISENKAETTLRNLKDALKRSDIKSARNAFNGIPDDSVYKQEAKELFLPAESELTRIYEDKAKTAAAEKNCKQVEKIVAEARKLGVDAQAKLVKCTEAVASSKPNGTGSGSGNTTTNGGSTTPPPSGCDAAALQAKGEDLLQTGMDAAALSQLEAAYRCKPEANLLRLSFLAACRSKNAAKAKLYYSKIPNAPTSITQICVRNGIQIP
ncbi:MAG: FHA domain-containing protein [Kofleriaceae bacterium]|nr:FHA domain-containing protein [Kofleriaceae bacterium]